MAPDCFRLSTPGLDLHHMSDPRMDHTVASKNTKRNC